MMKTHHWLLIGEFPHDGDSDAKVGLFVLSFPPPRVLRRIICSDMRLQVTKDMYSPKFSVLGGEAQGVQGSRERPAVHSRLHVRRPGEATTAQQLLEHDFVNNPPYRRLDGACQSCQRAHGTSASGPTVSITYLCFDIVLSLSVKQYKMHCAVSALFSLRFSTWLP